MCSLFSLPLVSVQGAKEVRFAAPEDTAALLGVTKGCITALSLVNDTANKVTPVWDSAILSLPTIRVCVGCEDPKNHSQHSVIDIAPADFLKFASSNGRAGPKLVTL